MISLRDSIEIRTTPARIFDWLGRMPQEYTSWHPDHVACRILHGSLLEVGSVIECEEYLHGKLHSMRFRTSEVVPSKRVEFVIERLGRGAFEAQESDDTVRFMAELEIGTDLPILGRLFDFIFLVLFKQRIESMRRHMAEEGRNLKAILESDPSKPIGRVAEQTLNK